MKPLPQQLSRLILPSLAALLIFGATNAAAQVNREVFDSRNVCKIHVPLDWQASQQNVKMPEGISTGGASHRDKSLMLVFAFDRANLGKSDVSIEDFLTVQVENLEKGSVGMAKGELKDGKIDGKPSKYLRATVKTNNADLIVFWSVIDGGKRIYLVQGSCHAENQAIRERQILESMASFREMKTE